MNPTLNTEPNIAQADDFYEALIDAHRDLSDSGLRMQQGSAATFLH
jgi:hypothetical protein